MAISVLRVSVLASFFSTSALSSAALADVPRSGPEPCTVEKVANGRDCILCRGAYVGNFDHCERQPTATGRTLECKTWGASSWGEVWCGPAAEAPEAVAPATDAQAAGDEPRELTEMEATPNSKKSGKGCNAGAALPGIAAAFGGVGTLLVRRRRRA